MKTAVEWLVEHLTECGFDLSHHELEIEQANKMFEDQIIDAFEYVDFNLDDGLHYYNEKFKLK